MSKPWFEHGFSEWVDMLLEDDKFLVRKYIQDLMALAGPPYVRGEYGEAWTNELRGRVMRRDGGRCVACGGEDRLCVHHVDGDKGNSSLENLVTLCWGCHEKVHGG